VLHDLSPYLAPVVFLHADPLPRTVTHRRVHFLELQWRAIMVRARRAFARGQWSIVAALLERATVLEDRIAQLTEPQGTPGSLR
jgi:hypothetical protein